MPLFAAAWNCPVRPLVAPRTVPPSDDMILIKEIILPHSYLGFPTPLTEQHRTATLYIRFSLIFIIIIIIIIILNINIYTLWRKVASSH